MTSRPVLDVLGDKWRKYTAPRWEGRLTPLDADGTVQPLHRGLVVAQMVAQAGSLGAVFASRATWSELEANVAWRDELQVVLQVAVMDMPKAVIQDLGVAAGRRPSKVPPPPRSPRAPAEPTITTLNAELVQLVADMSAYDRPSAAVQQDFARRYGRLRDQVARARADFLATEGMFETAQARLLQFMGQS
jgi:hypothetical protein